ncbi:MAG: hypothetical protein HY235_02740 [Acidobacteria bacterium]|nr:hypothetical protein [Acidobacteriota bacterium]
MQLFRLILVVPLLLSLSADLLLAQKRKRRQKKEEEEITQTLQVLPDPPATVTVDPQRLGFLTAPMTSKGLLSQQVRDGLRALRSQAHGAAIVKVRAFVAGTGDLRRVQSIVSEVFTESKQPLPALTMVRVGALPQEGAQVVLEAVTVERKPVNPNGLAFLSGQQVTAPEALEKLEPQFKESVARLQVALRAVRAGPADVLRATCFTSALADYSQLRQHLAEQFPKAALAIVQVLRGLSSALVECEAVARSTAAPAAPLEVVNPAGLAASPNYSQVALVNAPKAVLSSSQMAFNNQDADIRLAFERMKKTIEQAGGSLRNTVMTNYYPMSQSTVDKIRKIRFDFLDKSRPPASTMLLFEGLPSLDASFAMEVVALP